MKPVVMRTLLSLAVATALAGCSLAPTYERPQAPVDAAYPSGPAYGAPGQAAAGAPAAADVGWRDFFGDPLLQELLALSLANNRDLRVAALNVEAARLNPSGQAGISRSYQVGASLSTWELDLFGRIRSLSEQALQLYLAQDETRLATQLTLVAETANAYLTLRADQELLALTRQTLAAQQESYKLTRQSYDLGVATELDLSQAEISLRTAERNLSQYTRMAAQDRNALVLLVGQPLPAGTASASLGGLFDAGSGAWSFAPQISVPIFAGGALRASLDLAKIQKDIGIARYEQAIQSGFREVSDALAGRGTLQEQIRSQELLVQANQRAYDLSQQRYQQGIDNYLSVLDSQRSLYTAQQTLVETRLARLSNLIQLYKALGGGWSERTVAAAQAG